MMLQLVVAAAVLSSAAAGACTFCGADAAGMAHTFDLSKLSAKTFSLNGEVPQPKPQPPKEGKGEFNVASPCLGASAPECGPSQDPVLHPTPLAPPSVAPPCGLLKMDRPLRSQVLQGCREVGSLVGTNASVALTADGFNLTLAGGFSPGH